MNLQGKELVSLSTQRSARALMATAFVVVLAKHYAVLPSDLELVGVTISQTAVSGSIFWVVGFQAINHIVHWYGDYQSLKGWNSKEKVNGIARIGAGSALLTKLDKALESIDVLRTSRDLGTEPEKNRSDKLDTIKAELLALKPSIKSFQAFGAFYFFGWFLAFPLTLAILAISLP